MAEPELNGKNVRCKKCGSAVAFPEKSHSGNDEDFRTAQDLKTLREELNIIRGEIRSINKGLDHNGNE
jgi:hypothetical protein